MKALVSILASGFGVKGVVGLNALPKRPVAELHPCFNVKNTTYWNQTYLGMLDEFQLNQFPDFFSMLPLARVNGFLQYQAFKGVEKAFQDWVLEFSEKEIQQLIPSFRHNKGIELAQLVHHIISEMNLGILKFEGYSTLMNLGHSVVSKQNEMKELRQQVLMRDPFQASVSEASVELKSSQDRSQIIPKRVANYRTFYVIKDALESQGVDVLVVNAVHSTPLPYRVGDRTRFIQDPFVFLFNNGHRVFLIPNFPREKYSHPMEWDVVAKQLGIDKVIYSEATFEGGDVIQGMGENENLLFIGQVVGNTGRKVTDPEVLAKESGLEIVEIEKVEFKKFYHLDTFFAVIDENTALLYPGATDKKSISTLKEKFSNLIFLDKDDAENLASNLIILNNKVILMHYATKKLRKILKGLGYTLFVNSKFKTGDNLAGIHCLVKDLGSCVADETDQYCLQ